MNITFEWNDIALSPEQKARMEGNIRKEMPGLEVLSNHEEDLTVSLFKKPFLNSLEGAATNTAGEPQVKITHTFHNGTTSYVFLGVHAKQ